MGRFIALAIAAFITSEYGGLIPHARHGAKGVRSSEVYGSKLEGTGFEKEHIGQIHVPVLTGVGSSAGRWKGLARGEGDDVALLDGWLKLDTARFCTEDRFAGFGKRVIFAEDLKKPACNISA